MFFLRIDTDRKHFAVGTPTATRESKRGPAGVSEYRSVVRSSAMAIQSLMSGDVRTYRYDWNIDKG